MSSQDTLLLLVDDHLAGRLDERGRAELEHLLAEQPDAHRLFWIAVNHEILLRSALAGAAAANAEPSTTTRDWWRHPLIAAVALLLIAVGAAVTGWFATTPMPVADIANVAAVGNPGVVRHADGKQIPLRNGLPLATDDRIELGTDTSIDLRWRSEATVITLAGGSIATIARASDSERLRLDHGSLVAAVAHQTPGQQFAIATPEAQVTVIGTRFAVHTGDNRTEVDVEQGRVRVATLAGDKPVEINAGERAMRIAGQAPVIVPSQRWQWTDRRPIGVMMLSAANTGWVTNPRGWFNDQAIDVTTPAGLAAFQKRIDAQIDLAITLLHEQNAQGVVFWDLEGREHLIGYVGDPRQLARFAPEMDAAADRIFTRLREAGFAIGVALRAQAAVWEDQGTLPNLRTVNDSAGLLTEKIAYARQRWGATLFPILGQSGSVMGMETICRRVVALHPDVLLMPTAADADTYRWCGAWQDPQFPSTPDPAAARRSVPGAFGVHKALDAALLKQRYDELVHATANGDILTFRAWWRDPANEVVALIHAAGQAKPHP
ncbi:MAG TPA: FecR domain-containing protein [Planctomycetota bacterium]|nr:FecR domain-containing protein [Planctomycetota bacterium]